jgi:DNA-binding transcriptional regulator YhcF (GntR family)
LLEDRIKPEVQMSLKALNWALEVRAGNGTNKLVLMILADRYNEEFECAWPAVQWIADRAELSRRTVQRALRDLELQGLIIHDGWIGKFADRQSKRYILPIQNGASHCHPMTSTTRRGDIYDATGRHSDALTNREPLENRAPRTRRTRKPIDNLTAKRVPTPEETLQMLEQERAQ